MDQNELELFDKYYWSFIYLITQNPETFLTKKGKILYHMVLNKGQFDSITGISRKMKQDLSMTSVMCKELVSDGHIITFKESNRKVVIFDRKVIEDALRITYSLVKENDE